MLLRRYATNRRAMIAIAQCSLVIGLLCLLAGSLSQVIEPGPALNDFARGLLIGFGATMLGLSAVLNVRWLAGKPDHRYRG
jgi:hypothetical protein